MFMLPSEQLLMHYTPLYENFPLFHPSRKAFYLWGMRDSISLLISLDAERSGDTVQLFYESASHKLQGFRSASIDWFICDTTLLLNPCLLQSPANFS